MYCTKCGYRLPENAKFCPKCGAPVSIPAAPSLDKPKKSLFGLFKKKTPPAAYTSDQVVPPVAQPVTDPAPAIPKPQLISKTYKVTGMSHYMKNIMKLAVPNSSYDCTKRELIEEDLVNERVYEYDFYPEHTELVPEPDNPSDPKAIKVIVDGEHVGYIKSGSCSHLHKLLRDNLIDSIRCEMGGGRYKYIDEYEDEETEKTTYSMDRDTDPFWIHLDITEIKSQS